MASPLERLFAAGTHLTSDVVGSLPIVIPPDTLSTLPTPLTMITRSGEIHALFPKVNANMNVHVYRGDEDATSRVLASIEAVGCFYTERISPSVNIITEIGLLTHNRERQSREAIIAKYSGSHLFEGGAIHLSGRNESVEYWKAAEHTANVLKAKGQWKETQAMRELKQRQIVERGRPDRNADRAAARAAAGAGGSDSDSD